MATSIVNPSGSVPGFDTISNSFGQIYNMFAPNSSNSSGISGGSSGPFGVAPLTNPDNSLTGAWYNMYNLAGPTAAQLANTGSGLVNTGTGVAQGGIDMSAGGYGTTQTGLATMQPAIDFYTKLAGGDPRTMTAALAPTADALSTIEAGAMGSSSGGMPAGGYRAATMAGLPQTMAGKIGDAATQLQSTAAQQLGTLGGEQVSAGGTQANIGQGVSGVGTNLAGVGTTLTGQGQSGMDALISDIINKMQINYQNSGINQASTLIGSIGQLLGGAGNAAIAGKYICWIAEALYGADDVRTHVVRAYLNGPFQETAFGRFVIAIYRRYGQAVAAQVRKHDWLKRAFRPLFDRALESAVRRILWKPLS